MGGFAAFIKPLSASDGKRKEIEIGNLLFEIEFTVIFGIEDSISKKRRLKACSVKRVWQKANFLPFA